MPNALLNKAKSTFDNLVEKAISRTSPKVQSEVKKIASQSMDNLVGYCTNLFNAGVSMIFVMGILKRITGSSFVGEPVAMKELERGIFIVYNDVKTYNYYSKEV